MKVEGKVDTTLVSALDSLGHPRIHARSVRGAALRIARRAKERTYPDMPRAAGLLSWPSKSAVDGAQRPLSLSGSVLVAARSQLLRCCAAPVSQRVFGDGRPSLPSSLQESSCRNNPRNDLPCRTKWSCRPTLEHVHGIALHLDIQTNDNQSFETFVVHNARKRARVHQRPPAKKNKKTVFRQLHPSLRLQDAEPDDALAVQGSKQGGGLVQQRLIEFDQVGRIPQRAATVPVTPPVLDNEGHVPSQGLLQLCAGIRAACTA